MADKPEQASENEGGSRLMSPLTSTPATAVAALAAPVIADLRQLIQAVRGRVAATVNTELTLLYWHIGTRLRTETLGEKRADYGRQIVEQVAADLTVLFGKGFERSNLFRMIRLAEQFPEEAIVATLSPQLDW